MTTEVSLIKRSVHAIDMIIDRLGFVLDTNAAADQLSASRSGYPGDDYKGGQLFAKIDGAKRTQDFRLPALQAQDDALGFQVRERLTLTLALCRKQ
jgi:hypothetical protein